MAQKDCRRMTKNCQRGNTVTVRRMWPTGEESSFNICPHSGGSRLREFDESRFTNHAGEHFYFERDYEDEDKWNCKLHGNAVMQDEGEVCLVTGDCDDDPDLDLRCAAVDSVVAECKGICRRYRWAQRRVDACVLNCDLLLLSFSLPLLVTSAFGTMMIFVLLLRFFVFIVRKPSTKSIQSCSHHGSLRKADLAISTWSE